VGFFCWLKTAQSKHSPIGQIAQSGHPAETFFLSFFPAAATNWILHKPKKDPSKTAYAPSVAAASAVTPVSGSLYFTRASGRDAYASVTPVAETYTALNLDCVQQIKESHLLVNISMFEIFEQIISITYVVYIEKCSDSCRFNLDQ
jgi:hypothetical protein